MSSQIQSIIQHSYFSMKQDFQKQTKMIYLIRHAESEYNIAEKKIAQKHGPDFQSTADYLNNKFDLKLQDAGITKLGFEQSAKCAKLMKDKKIELVVVTPLRRAMSTCHEIFKEHPEKPPIMVDPDFRQIMESACDIGSLLRQSKAEYPHFDYSLIDDIDAWYVHTIRHPQYRNQILKALEGVQDNQRNNVAKEATLEVLKDAWEKRRNGDQGLKENMLASVSRQKQKLLDLMKNYKSIALVSHSENIKRYVGYKIKNCEVYELSLQQLQKLEFQKDTQPWSQFK